jgi:hypothetical protein
MVNMWPFGKIKNNSVEKIKNHRKEWPLGKKFKYLGINMVVVSNVLEEFAMEYSYCTPYIKAHYVNNNGVIETIIFYENELEMLE